MLSEMTCYIHLYQKVGAVRPLRTPFVSKNSSTSGIYVSISVGIIRLNA